MNVELAAADQWHVTVWLPPLGGWGPSPDWLSPGFTDDQNMASHPFSSTTTSLRQPPLALFGSSLQHMDLELGTLILDSSQCISGLYRSGHPVSGAICCFSWLSVCSWTKYYSGQKTLLNFLTTRGSMVCIESYCLERPYLFSSREKNHVDVLLRYEGLFIAILIFYLFIYSKM